MTHAVHVIATASRRGAETFAMDLVKALEVGGTAGVLTAVEPAAGELDVPLLGERWPSAIAVARLRHLVRSTDVVVAHGSTALPAVAVALLGRRTPFVYRMIGDPSYWARSRLARARVGWALRRAHAIVVLWDEAAPVVRERYGVEPSRLRVIPTGVDQRRFAPSNPAQRSIARAHLGVDGDEPVGVVIGALSAEKNVTSAIRAVGAIADMRLLIAGSGPQRGALEALASQIAPGRIHFCGSVADTATVLAAADVVLMPSRSEGVPAVLIEAAMAGVPVVATRVGGIGVVVVDGVTGSLVPAGDDLALVEAIRHVLTRGPSGVEAERSRIVEKFDIEVVSESWHAVLETAAHGG